MHLNVYSFNRIHKLQPVNYDKLYAHINDFHQSLN